MNINKNKFQYMLAMLFGVCTKAPTEDQEREWTLVPHAYELLHDSPLVPFLKGFADTNKVLTQVLKVYIRDKQLVISLYGGPDELILPDYKAKLNVVSDSHMYVCLPSDTNQFQEYVQLGISVSNAEEFRFIYPKETATLDNLLEILKKLNVPIDGAWSLVKK